MNLRTEALTNEDIDNKHALLTYFSVVFRGQNMRCPETCHIGKVFHWWEEQLLKSEKVHKVRTSLLKYVFKSSAVKDQWTHRGLFLSVVRRPKQAPSSFLGCDVSGPPPILTDAFFRFLDHAHTKAHNPALFRHPKTQCHHHGPISGGLNLDNDCLCFEKAP